MDIIVIPNIFTVIFFILSYKDSVTRETNILTPRDVALCFVCLAAVIISITEKCENQLHDIGGHRSVCRSAVHI